MMHIKIVSDSDPTNPREYPREYDNLGLMACWHNRYNLGDVQPTCTPREWLTENAPKGSIVIALWLYDHSGITIRADTATGGNPFTCQWDSGQVGWIVATPDAIRKSFAVGRITAKHREQAEAVLRSEVEAYDHYLVGNVWGFVIERDVEPCASCGIAPEREYVDSCWGFIGDDLDSTGIADHVDPELRAALETAWDNRHA